MHSASHGSLHAALLRAFVGASLVLLDAACAQRAWCAAAQSAPRPRPPQLQRDAALRRRRHVPVPVPRYVHAVARGEMGVFPAETTPARARLSTDRRDVQVRKTRRAARTLARTFAHFFAGAAVRAALAYHVWRAAFAPMLIATSKTASSTISATIHRALCRRTFFSNAQVVDNLIRVICGHVAAIYTHLGTIRSHARVMVNSPHGTHRFGTSDHPIIHRLRYIAP
eukprot:3738481-Pleurochrysis_carterae.AAC.1